MRCCVASIFEMPYEAVPHFAESGDCIAAMNDWLRAIGIPLRAFDFEYPESSTVEEFVESADLWWWIGVVRSALFKGTTHGVVMHGSDVAYDPTPIHPVRPYRFIGGIVFVATNPVVVIR